MTIRGTSMSAYRGNSFGAQEQLVYETIAANKGVTRAEVALITNVRINAVCGRVKSLLDEGWVVELERRECGATGHSAYPLVKSRTTGKVGMDFTGFDIETASDHPAGALQPWRAEDGSGRITSVAVCSGTQPAVSFTDPAMYQAVLDGLKGKAVATWNGVFDLAWLIAAGYDLEGIHWFDAMLLWKLHSNSQRMELFPKWSLSDGVVRWLCDGESKTAGVTEYKPDPWVTSYLNMKAAEVDGQSDQYWEERGTADAYVTRVIANQIWRQLTPQQRRLGIIQSSCMVPVAKSWVSGVHLDADSVSAMRYPTEKEMYDLELALGVCNGTSPWAPSKVLRSPKQMGELLYDRWGLAVEYKTAKGQRSTAKAALTYLADKDDRVLDILRWRELNTNLSKFVLGTLDAINYLGSPITHPGPKLGSTYTGRMTYSSRSGRKGDAYKAKIGIPIHQMPRAKEMRSLVVAPPGYYILEYDAAGQEMRGMALASNDQQMLELFRSEPPYDDAHSFTGSRLAGIPFDEFLRLKAEKDVSVVGPRGFRHCGKYCNLSFQYRSGVKTSRIQARVQYGINADWQEIKNWQSTYFNTYPGVKDYWRDAIGKARALGYAETFAGRRFKIDQWLKNPWGSESSAINFPIQGFGADQKELAIAKLTQSKLPLQFGWDLHDGLYMLVKKDAPIQVLWDGLALLDNLPYKKMWHWEPDIPLPWDASFGPSWGKKIEVAWGDDVSGTLEEVWDERM